MGVPKSLSSPMPAPRHTNRLARESSPYLLQHAHNPVDWFAWGDEAFAEARRRDVPIFLSIGYSTCYWCHVMERESFHNEEIAAILNSGFVCIKVDREERPAIDELYMAATTITTGHGGWPMSVFLEPKSLRPFYCGTYFPGREMPGLQGRPTFPALLNAITNLWKNKRAEVEAQSQQIANAVAEQVADDPKSAGASLGQEQVADAVAVLLRIFDPVDGGFSRAPKFPQPVFLEFLLDARRVVDEETRKAIDRVVRLTLDKMACGGIFDQVGGGFHRYSVDAHWIVPHFEKMLYDQAQLSRVYTRASRVFGDSFYAKIARRTLDFVLRELTNSRGAFISAIDAEVDAREGLNYLWQPADIDAALGSDMDAAFARDVYGLDAGANFKDPHHPQDPARSVLHVSARPEQVADRMGIAPTEFAARLDAINARLLAHRGTRRQPHTDDKVLASWNGLTIAAFADAGVTLGEARYVEAAATAAEFVWREMRVENRGLTRAWRDGPGRAPGVLEDYACMIEGCAALARANAEKRTEYSARANALLAIIEADFAEPGGAVLDAPRDSGDLFVRLRSSHDGATPSALSVLLHALIDLEETEGKGTHAARARTLLASIADRIAASPVSAINSTRALLRLLLRGEVPKAGERPDVRGEVPSTRALSRHAHPDFTPVEIYAGVDRVVISKEVPASLTLFVRIAPGYHVIAAEPGTDVPGMFPFRVGIVHGSGVSAYADYPEGTAFGVPGAGAVRVNEGEFELPVAIELDGEFGGTPLLSVAYQACNNCECLEPRTVEIDVAIDRG